MRRILSSSALIVSLSLVCSCGSAARSGGGTGPEVGDGAFPWLIGTWRSVSTPGEPMGSSRYEERWSRAPGGGLVGMFWLASGDDIGFLELLTIESGDSPDDSVLRLKHFNADLSGWEEAGPAEAWRQVPVDGEHEDVVAFERPVPFGTERLTYVSPDPSSLGIRLNAFGRDGEPRESFFLFERVTE